MQQFAINILTERADKGVSGKYVGAKWQQANGRTPKAASRDSFGATSAGYRALRALVDEGKARVESKTTTGGYTILTYYPA